MQSYGCAAPKRGTGTRKIIFYLFLLCRTQLECNNPDTAIPIDVINVRLSFYFRRCDDIMCHNLGHCNHLIVEAHNAQFAIQVSCNFVHYIQYSINLVLISYEMGPILLLVDIHINDFSCKYTDIRLINRKVSFWVDCIAVCYIFPSLALIISENSVNVVASFGIGKPTLIMHPSVSIM